jgi:ribose-phosphate pyrophosphokinase
MITVNGMNVDWTKFPNGEIGLDLRGDSAHLTWSYQGDHEIFQLGILANQFVISSLDIKYLPYSRMDRVKGDWAFTLKNVCKAINDCKFMRVDVAEPHSDVSMALLNDAEAYYPTALYFDQVCKNIGFVKGTDYLVFPDAGAEKRYSGMYPGHRYLVGTKLRNFDTGKIEAFRLVQVTNPGFEANQAIIIDDLCSYGGTFLATANELERGFGIKDVTLLVAHLETSVHRGHLLDSDVVKRIYATRSIYHPTDVNALRPHEKIKLYEVEAA